MLPLHMSSMQGKSGFVGTDALLCSSFAGPYLPRKQLRVHAAIPPPAPQAIKRVEQGEILEPPAPRPQTIQEGVAAYVATGTRSLAGQVWNALPFWRAQPNANASGEAVIDGDFVREVAKQAAQVEKRAKKTAKKQPVDIRRFLKQTGLMETQYIRMLSSLSALSYLVPKLTAETVYRKYRLHLVTTSVASERIPMTQMTTASEAINEGDGMAACLQDVQELHRRMYGMEENGAEEPVKLEAKKVKGVSPGDLVASSLAAAAAVASQAASALPIQAVGSSLQTAAAAGHSTAAATVATVSAAVASSLGGQANKKAPPPKEWDLSASPTAWYVADDPVTMTRYFVIQGSDNFDHWKLNLTFDPVQFEDPELGVKVHRGIYEAAQIMYHRFLPMIVDHVRASPFAKIVFTGHSLGGSLGTMLMLMFIRRGVVPPNAFNPCYTFGAPAIFCEGGSGCGPCSSSQPAEEDSDPVCPADVDGNGGSSLLHRLGLPEGAIRNVMMSRDIVPRAFACNYASVADILARVSDGFRDHVCLQNGSRQVLYYFLGKVIVLQPDPLLKFVQEAGHPMLPEGPGLYTLREPNFVELTATPAPPEVRMGAISVSDSYMGNISPATSLTRRTSSDGDVPVPAPQLGDPAPTLTDAIMELLDLPHPLDTLADTASYGADGSISRYHNPDNYTRAIAGIIRARTKPWRQLLAERGKAPRQPSAGPRWYAPMIEGPRRLAAVFLRRNTAAALASAVTQRRMVETAPAKDASSSYCSTA